MRRIIVFAIAVLSSFKIYSQSSIDYKSGLKVSLDQEGKKYFRIMSWVHANAQYRESSGIQSPVNSNLRRARVMMYSQFNKDLLVLTHFGLNNLNPDNQSPLGTGNASQLLLHDAWLQYNINQNHSIGAGLHYFNGISRLNNTSTINLLTLDNNRQSWSTLGLSDQLSRHIGIFAKGSIGNMQYRVAANQAIANGLDSRDPFDPNVDYSQQAIYAGNKLLGSKLAGFTYSGYFEFQLLEKESNFLPFKVGTYLGEKKVFNIGFGTFIHPNGAVLKNNDVDSPNGLAGENVQLSAVDVFYESPLGFGDAITAYASYQINDYGTNYLYSVYGSGKMFYSHLGYLLPMSIAKSRIQVYSSFSNNNFDAVIDSKNNLKVGSNIYLDGNNFKLTFEYEKESFLKNIHTFTLQAQLYI